MNLALLASLIILALSLSAAIKHQNKKQKNASQAFWERERLANSVRRKSLDNLEYITIPLERFPTHLLRDSSDVTECISILETLSAQRIVNLTGYSNTDLKLEYGAANITLLTEYDQNYTLLVRTVQKWADLLLESDYDEEAKVLMEFAISTYTDVSRTYFKLAEIYASRLETGNVQRLIDIAKTLRSSNKDIIVRTLQESYL